MLANLKPGVRLELYLAGLCFSMLMVIAAGCWWVSQRQSSAGEYFYSTNPQHAAVVRPSDESPQGGSRPLTTAEGGVERTQQRTQKRAQQPTTLQMSY